MKGPKSAPCLKFSLSRSKEHERSEECTMSNVNGCTVTSNVLGAHTSMTIDSTPPSVRDAQDLQTGKRLVGIVGKSQGLRREADVSLLLGL
jgi:hypothetical protein